MKRPVRCGETISEEHLGALPQFSIIGVHMPISPSARPPHLLAIQKTTGGSPRAAPIRSDTTSSSRRSERPDPLSYCGFRDRKPLPERANDATMEKENDR